MYTEPSYGELDVLSENSPVRRTLLPARCKLSNDPQHSENLFLLTLTGPGSSLRDASDARQKLRRVAEHAPDCGRAAGPAQKDAYATGLLRQLPGA